MKQTLFALLFLFAVHAFSGEPVRTADFLRAPSPAAVFTVGEPLRFALGGRAGSLPCTVRDIRGETVLNGVIDGTDSLTLPPLPRGYYDISIDTPEFTGSRSFGVVMPPRFSGESPYCLDSAPRGMLGAYGKFLAARGYRSDGPGGAMREIETMYRLLGCRFVRHRVQNLRTDPATANLADDRLLPIELAGTAAGEKRIVNILNLLPWLQKEGSAPYSLDDLYRFCRELATQGRGKVALWEIMNEIDLSPGFTVAPWDYASLAKTAYLGLKAGDPDAGVSISSLCLTQIGELQNELFRNALAAYTDIFNYHVYSDLRDYPGRIAALRAFQKKHGFADRPIWITENGTQAEGDAVPDGLSPGTLSLNREQELIWAEFIPKSQLVMQSLGVERTFLFVLRRHVERRGFKEWGLLRTDFSAKPGFVAFNVLVSELGGAQCLGSCDFGPGITALLFRQADGSQSLALWSHSELDTERGRIPQDMGRLFKSELRLPAEDGVRGVDCFGTPLALERQGVEVIIPVTRFPAYLHGLSGLNASKKTPPRGRFGAPEEPELDKTAVLAGAVLPDGRIRLTIHNFSPEPKTGRLTVNTAWEGFPRRLELAPFGKQVFDLPAPAAAKADSLDIGGELNGKRITQLSLPRALISDGWRICKEADDPANWKHNSSGEMSIIRDEKEQALRVDVSFRTRDRWVYPRLAVPPEFRNATAVRFEIKTPDGSEKETSLCWLRKAGRAGIRVNYSPSLGEWMENTVRIPADDSPLEAVEIGMNPHADKRTYWIRNIRFL
ncbi:MAG: hypothetical protein HPZ91_05700 [Lentisphaeria bacterium]|nr:hypothetical protein [Lentisphaeria bacterium]